MAFNWPFSNYGFCGLLGISVTPFFIFTNFSSAHPVANNLLWTLTGPRASLASARTRLVIWTMSLFQHKVKIRGMIKVTLNSRLR